MRPRGEVRQAVASAATVLSRQHGSCTGRDVAAWANAGFEKTRRTLSDMVRAGELVVVGQARAPGVCRPLNLYAPPVAQSAPGADLFRAVQRWADFR